MGTVAVFYPGPPGPPGGAGGQNGLNGKSPYQLAVDNGFVGTEAQWLESLKGEVVVVNPDIIGSTLVTDITVDTPIYGSVPVTSL